MLYVLTANGRVETTNYRTVKMPANMDLPVYVRGEFARTYKAALRGAGRARGLSRDVHRVFLGHELVRSVRRRSADAGGAARRPACYWVGEPHGRGGGQPVMLTRLHLRYTRDSLPEDLVFQETQDRTNFQARYVLRHPWAGSVDACEAAKPYFDAVRARREREAQTLASLTGANLADIRARMALPAEPPVRWWETLWK